MYTRPTIGQVTITALALAVVYSMRAAAHSPRPPDLRILTRQETPPFDDIEYGGTQCNRIANSAGAYAGAWNRTQSRGVFPDVN